MTRTPFAALAETDASADNAWYRQHAYDPPFLKVIAPEDHSVLIEWHHETRRRYPNAGSSGVEMMTLLTGLIMSSEIKRVVQCGHYVGFSTLLIGMIGRCMNRQRLLYTVDVAEGPSSYTQSWVEQAGLTELVKVAVHDSSDPVCVDEAREYLGGPPELVYVDSSHQYNHTRAELMQWWEQLPPGGLLVMDDVSGWAASFDQTGKGGSHRAAVEFSRAHAPNGVILNASLYAELNAKLVYTDVCGFGLFQKPYPFASAAR